MQFIEPIAVKHIAHLFYPNRFNEYDYTASKNRIWFYSKPQTYFRKLTFISWFGTKRNCND